MNGAAYLVEMDADGGMKRYPTNKAGAKYGTGAFLKFPCGSSITSMFANVSEHDPIPLAPLPHSPTIH